MPSATEQQHWEASERAVDHTELGLWSAALKLCVIIITGADALGVVGVRAPPEFWTSVSDTLDFLADMCNNTIVFNRNVGLLKHYTVILVYAFYKSFNYK